MATLKTIRSGKRSQWRLINASVMCSDRLKLAHTHTDHGLAIYIYFVLRLSAASVCAVPSDDVWPRAMTAMGVATVSYCTSVATSRTGERGWPASSKLRDPKSRYARFWLVVFEMTLDLSMTRCPSLQPPTVLGLDTHTWSGNR